MSKAPRKLTLTRETLLPLQNSELAAINGGTATPAVFIATRVSVVASRAGIVASARFCSGISAVTLNTAAHGFTVVPGVINTAKKVSGALLRPAHPAPFENARFGPGVTGR
ncbi:MAG: hypothetical protein E6J90_39720 [Deltaproteobacteria bacterium]|nr:MAG: hypothetical protein E6J90_39720 [Deltaproteobacteria bacterium]